MNRRTFMIMTGCSIATFSVGDEAQGVDMQGGTPNLLPGMTRQAGDVFLTENHCNSLIAWHVMGVTDATVVHIDTHDDFRAVSQKKITELKLLLDKGDYREVFLNSDTSQFLKLKKKDADLLYDLGNFLYPCMELGIVSRVYWVVPDRQITEEQSIRLQAMTKHNLPVQSIKPHGMEGGGFTANIQGVELIVLTLDALPELGPGTLLDIDVDFFSFAKAMTNEHLIGEVSRDPEECLAILKQRTPSPKAITISASVWGGYTPLLQRFIGDAIFDFYTKGNYPEEARVLLKAIAELKAGNADLLPVSDNISKTFVPAWRHQQALRQLSTGRLGEAQTSIEAAATQNPVYRKGLLDLAEALLAMKQPATAHGFIDSFDRLNSGRSYNSLAIRAMAYIEQGNAKKALLTTGILKDWDSNPYTLLLHGAALKVAGMLDEAVTCFEDILARTPDNASANFNLGLIEEERGATSKAILRYRQAIASRHDFWQAYENLGYIMLVRKKYALASDILKSAVAINPFSVTSINNLGLAYAKQMRPDKAIPFYIRALSLSPENTAIQLNLADALFVTDKQGEAAYLCKDILKKGANDSAQRLLDSITHR